MAACRDRRIPIISACLNLLDRTSVTIYESYESNRALANTWVFDCDNLVAILEIDIVGKPLFDSDSVSSQRTLDSHDDGTS